ncbi:MAG: DUF2537 domain-containing protein [Actinophytocola sp.]|nr:DUF2537 domain-containing protein [Actinophytocola sp.]
MELRVRGDRAVLTSEETNEVAPENLPLGADLAAALHEWARVAAAMRRASMGQRSGLTEPGEDVVGVVSRRGHQLARRVASEMRIPVHYRDPVTEIATVVVPNAEASQPRGPRHASPHGTRLFRRTPGEPTPWGTGLTVSVFFAAVVFVGLLALTSTLARGVNGWVAVAAAIAISGGMAPSLWLGRHVPILRWVCLGAAAGLVASWVGLLFVLL